MPLKSTDLLDPCPCDGEVCLSFLDHCLLVCKEFSAHFHDHDGHHHRYHYHQSFLNWVNKTVLCEWKRQKSPGINNWKCIQVFTLTWAVHNGFQPRLRLHWTNAVIWLSHLHVQCCAIYTPHMCPGSGEASVSFHAGALGEQIYFHSCKQWVCAARRGTAESSQNEYICWERHAPSLGLSVPFALCRTKDLNSISAPSVWFSEGTITHWGLSGLLPFFFFSNYFII